MMINESITTYSSIFFTKPDKGFCYTFCIF